VKNIDKLPHHKQMAIFYETVGMSRTRIAEIFEVTKETVTLWRGGAVYQAALQEARIDLRERLFDEHAAGMKFIVQGFLHETVKRIQQDDLEGMPTDKMIKSLKIAFDIYNQMGLNSPPGEKSGDDSDSNKRSDPFEEMRKRIASPTGEEVIEEEEKE